MNKIMSHAGTQNLKLWQNTHRDTWHFVWTLILLGRDFVLQMHLSLFLHVNLSEETRGCGRVMQSAVNRMKASGSPRASTYCPTPRCEELTPSAGPECTSNRGPKDYRHGSRSFSQLLHFKHLDTRLHSSVTKKELHLTVRLQARDKVCVWTGVSQKWCHQCGELKRLLWTFADNLSGITKAVLMSRQKSLRCKSHRLFCFHKMLVLECTFIEILQDAVKKTAVKD